MLHMLYDIILLCISWPVTMSSDVTDMWQYITNFIQLVSPQPVDQFSQTKMHWKAQVRAIHTYAEGTKATTNDWDIRPSVAVKALSANISWTAE